MSKNLIFYFTGTGNSLNIAREVGKKLTNCKLVSIGPNDTYTLSQAYSSIGFIYPTYFQGVPIKVVEFISKLDFKHNIDTYLYAITTYGALVGNAISQLKDILLEKNVNLNYGEKLLMVSNYIIMYDPGNKIKERNENASKKIIPIIENIINKNSNTIGKPNPVFTWYYNKRVKTIPSMDKNYNVSNKCTSCGICEKVCPVNNIRLINNKPIFLHHCEQCTACIQFCPNEAINYKNKTQNRRRYTHKDVNYKDLTLKSIFID